MDLFAVKVKALGVSLQTCKGDLCGTSQCALPAFTGSVDFRGLVLPLALLGSLTVSSTSGETRLCSLGTLHFFQLCVCACVCVCVCARACMCAHVCVSSGCFQVKIAAGRAEGDLSLWSHRLRWWQRSGRSVAVSTAVHNF